MNYSMKRLCTLLLILFIHSVAVGQNGKTDKGFTIQAFLPQWKGATAKLIVDGRTTAITKVEADMYSFSGVSTKPSLAILALQKKAVQLFVPLFIEEGLIRIRTQTQYNLIPYGTPLNELYTHTIEQFDSITRSENIQQPAVKNFKRQLASLFIRQHPASLISLKFLEDFFYLDPTANDTLYFQLFQGLDSVVKTTATAAKMNAELSSRYVTAIGQKAPAMQLPNVFKQKEDLFDTGSFTLIHFWASWCAPCRKEHTAIKKMASRFGAKNFLVVSVSLDTNTASWKNAIKEEGLSWRQLSELKGWEGVAPKTYGVKAVPANFLIDPDGIIIAKDISLAELQKKLEFLLK